MAKAGDSDAAKASGSQTIATVERAADLLTLFARADESSLGVTEIAKAMGLSKAAVHRILSSLRGRGFIELDGITHRYRLGPASFALGLSYLSRLDVHRIAASELADLSRTTGETATLSVLVGDARIYVDQVTPAREIVMSVPLGRRFPLHAGSSSKALLAFLSESEQDALLTDELVALTGTTLVDREELLADLREVRKRGYAVSVGERQAGAASVAAPVFDHMQRPVASISICGPADRFEGGLVAAAEALLPVTARISSRLGYTSRADPLQAAPR